MRKLRQGYGSPQLPVASLELALKLRRGHAEGDKFGEAEERHQPVQQDGGEIQQRRGVRSTGITLHAVVV